MLLYEDDLVKRIESVIESLRAGFFANGGDIHFVKYEQGIVYVHIEGSYVGYPSDPKSVHAMIDRHVRMEIPEVDGVEIL